MRRVVPAMLLITNVQGSGIEGGVSRRITKGDVVIIPGHTPHWWSELETDIEYPHFPAGPRQPAAASLGVCAVRRQRALAEGGRRYRGVDR